MCDLKYQSKSHFVIIKALDTTAIDKQVSDKPVLGWHWKHTRSRVHTQDCCCCWHSAQVTRLGLPGHPSHLRQGLGRTRPYLVRPTSAVGSCPPRDGSPANSTETPALIHYERELTARDCHCNFLESSDNRLMGILLS